MKLIVLSRNRIHKSELPILIGLFENGLETFHLRKPRSSSADIEQYLKEIPQKFLNKVVLHSKHHLAPKYGLKGIHLTRKHRRNKLKTWIYVNYLKAKHPILTVSSSFHSLETLAEQGEKYDYSFLSPIFKSISKKNYDGKFERLNLNVLFKSMDQQVIALGGVDLNKIKEVHKMGFSGAGILGAIWTNSDPVAHFIKISKECKNQSLVSA